MTERRVSGLERVWMTAGAMDPSFAQFSVLRPVSMPPVDAWQKAWRDLVAVRPGLRLRARGWLRSTRWIDTGTAPLEVVDADWDGATDHPAMHLPLHPRKGPTVRLLVSRRAAVLVAHHAVLDGRGCWQVARDLLAVLDGEPPIARGLAPLDLAVAQAESPSRFVELTGSQQRLIETTPTQATGSVWVRRTLPSMTRPLARVIRAIGHQAKRPIMLGLPVDLRRYVEGAVGDGNLTGVAHTAFGPRQRLDTIANEVQLCLVQRRACAHVVHADSMRSVPLWLMKYAGKSSAKRQQAQNLYPVTATLSNLGHQPLTLRGQPVDAWFIPPYSRGMPLFLAMVGDDRGIEMVGVAPRALGDNGRLEALMDALVSRIDPVADPQPSRSASA